MNDKNIYEILKKFWNYDSFRSLQENIIKNVINKKNTLTLLPTGGGKSICFQIPALVLEGVTVVVSPLIALMNDQIFQLKKRGIAAETIHSGISLEEFENIISKVEKNKIKFLYLSPERLLSEKFLLRSKNFKVSLFAIDEAHCISQWGYDFRPSYLKIPDFIKNFPGVPTIALTATATNTVKEDIIKKLSLKNCATFQKSFERKNLTYAIVNSEDKINRLVRILKKIEGSAIIYVNSRKKTFSLAEFLNKEKLKATYYNGGLTPEEREKNQNLWITDEKNIMVATNAFGMGIDKPNVRLVVHAELPSSLEAYYQEAGRAGRDGKESHAIVLFTDKDIEDLRENFLLNNPEITQIKEFYKNLSLYYELGIGKSNEKKYSLNLDSFAKKYKYSPYKIKVLLQFLENYNLISFTENFFQKSFLTINSSIEELKSFYNTNEKISNVLKTILRIYGGSIIYNTAEIDEKKISFNSNVSTTDISNILKYLHKTEVLVYSLNIEKQIEICFLGNIYNENNLPINFEKISERKKILKNKLEEVIKYITHQMRCRSQILLDYFDEYTDNPCGKCDYCLENKSASTDEHEKYCNKIKLKLKNSPAIITDLVDSFSLSETRNILKILSLMLENEEIEMDFDEVKLNKS